MRYFSMFSGIGGFELGIGNKGECVGYSEIDKHAIKTYEKHFGGHKNYGDATKINPSELPDFDLLVGGFPCQAFSIAGQRRGFEDTRGTLFFEIARIVKAKQPRMFLLENVKGLLNHDKGETFTTILQTIDELGYDAEWQVLNSKHFGVPQNRERVFIIGHLRGTSSRQIFPLRQDAKEIDENKTVVRTLTGGGHSGGLHSQMTGIITGTLRTNDGKGFREMKEEISPCILARAREDGIGQPCVIKNPLKDKTNYGWHFEQNVYSIDSHTRALKSSEGSGNKLKLLKENKIRRLTPVECERLQGFPDNWTLGSDTQRYKQCGNAVTVNVIEAIFNEIIKKQ